MKPKALFLIILSLTMLGGAFVGSLVQAVPAPGRSSVITPGGQTTPCTYDNYQDSGKFIGKDCTTGDNKFSESTAYALAQDENASNVKRFWEGGTWDFSLSGATEGTINIVNVEDWGVYGQTVFKCSSSGCIAWSIGNQNAVDSNYHAQNITLHDIVFDGAGLSNSACIGVTTALNVYIDHVILQNCYELGTGCFRLTNWNTQQLLSKGVYIENSQFIKCKITLSGDVNGYLRNSAFIGLANGASGTKALVDFSKGDIVPTAVNNLANFCFCGNTISGWTLQAFLGFQAISNDTIANNTVRDANTFMQTTDTAGGLYFEGLVVADNYYSSSTGNFASVGYGHSIIIRSNIVSFDTNAAGASTAISIEKSIDPMVNQQPKNIAIINNEIYKWGGIGMDIGFTDGLVSGNEIYDVNQANGNANSNAGISTGSNLVGALISGNTIISDVGSGAGQSRPITYNGGQNITITGNNLQYINCGLYANGCGISIGSTIDTAKSTVIIRNNPGANPYGVIATPFSNTGSVTVGLSGSTATPTQGNTYKDIGVDLCFWSSGGSISVTLKDAGGNTIATGLTTLSDTCIQVGFTINFNTFSGATETVVGL